MEMKRAITGDDVQRAFEDALSALGVEEPLAQGNVKCAVVVTVDRLVGQMYDTGDPLPWIHANRINFAELGGVLLNSQPDTWKPARRTRNTEEKVVDILVRKGLTDPFVTLVSAESEASDSPFSPTSDSRNNCRFWDLYKLLQVPSPLKVFVTCTDRDQVLLRERIAATVRSYWRLHQDGDRVFALMLPGKSGRGLRRCGGWVRRGNGVGGRMEALAS